MNTATHILPHHLLTTTPTINHYTTKPTPNTLIAAMMMKYVAKCMWKALETVEKERPQRRLRHFEEAIKATSMVMSPPIKREKVKAPFVMGTPTDPLYPYSTLPWYKNPLHWPERFALYA